MTISAEEIKQILPYEVRFDIIPFKLATSGTGSITTEWLRETFGGPLTAMDVSDTGYKIDNPNAVWDRVYAFYRFKFEHDAVEFVLRFGA